MKKKDLVTLIVVSYAEDFTKGDFCYHSAVASKIELPISKAFEILSAIEESVEYYRLKGNINATNAYGEKANFTSLKLITDDVVEYVIYDADMRPIVNNLSAESVEWLVYFDKVLPYDVVDYYGENQFGTF